MPVYKHWICIISETTMDANPPADAPPERFNAARHLLGRNRARASKLAYIDDRSQLSYGELDERVRRFGAGLLALGVQPEQRVLMLLQDSIDFPVAFLGALYAGVVPVP